uniref:RMI1_C domain-containing protein n=1 Tax=Heterorhabditis bacteriophora TaxID=37862 RepID=A0A1I7XLP6_HETBA
MVVIKKKSSKTLMMKVRKEVHRMVFQMSEDLIYQGSMMRKVVISDSHSSVVTLHNKQTPEMKHISQLLAAPPGQVLTNESVSPTTISSSTDLRNSRKRSSVNHNTDENHKDTLVTSNVTKYDLFPCASSSSDPRPRPPKHIHQGIQKFLQKCTSSPPSKKINSRKYESVSTVKVEVIDLDSDEDIKPTITKKNASEKSDCEEFSGDKAVVSDVTESLRVVDGMWTMKVVLQDESLDGISCLVDHSTLSGLIGLSPEEAMAIRSSSDISRRQDGQRRLAAVEHQLSRLDLLIELEMFSQGRAESVIRGIQTLGQVLGLL